VVLVVLEVDSVLLVGWLGWLVIVSGYLVWDDDVLFVYLLLLWCSGVIDVVLCMWVEEINGL